MANAVKSTFEYQGQTRTAYWNGKEYANGTRYLSISDGSNVTVNKDGKAVNVNKAHSLEFGQAAVESMQGRW